MRERWARRLAWISCCLVLVFTAAFAATYNSGTGATHAEPVVPPPAATPADDAELIASGRAVYDSLDCSSCHSIAGQGSPRSPLDGVGGQLDRAAIRAWVLGEESVAEELSPRALRTKQAYAELEPERLEALIAYLASLED